MKKILFITRSLSITEGQGRYSVEMLKHLANDFEITVYTSERPQPEEKELENLPFKIKDLPKTEKLTNLFVFIWQNLRLLPAFFKADFVHFFSDYPHCALFCFLPLKLKTRFVTVHGTNGVAPLNNKISGTILKLAYKNVKKIICVSEFTKNQILKKINLNNITVIHNGINLNKFKQLNTDIFFKRAENIILSVGNPKNRKGYHISLPAFALAKKQFPDLKYYIVGSKPDDVYFSELQKIIKEHALENDVKFFRNISDAKLVELYYQSTVFILTPIVIKDIKFEGFGLVYLEANVCGLPVIGTRGCGAEDAIKDGYSGLLVEQNKIKDTAEALIKLLTDSNLRQKLGEQGKNWAKNFSWEKVAQKYKIIYDQKN